MPNALLSPGAHRAIGKWADFTTAADQVSTNRQRATGRRVLSTRQTSLGTTPLLSSFYFRFDHDDHPLKTIEVLPRAGGTLTDIAFADRDPTQNMRKTIIRSCINVSPIGDYDQVIP